MASIAKYSRSWRDKVEHLLQEASEYHWLETETGKIRNDPDPNTDELPAELECPVVLIANVYADKVGEGEHKPSAWEQAANYLGFNAYEARVLMCTLDTDAVTFERTRAQKGALGRRWVEAHWNKWLRGKAEQILLGENDDGERSGSGL